MSDLIKASPDDFELDIQFGNEPLGLAHIVKDKAVIATGTIVLTWLGFSVGGPLVAGIALYMGINDLKLKQEKSDSTPWYRFDDEFEGETLEADAETVIEEDNADALAKFDAKLQQPDNWVDQAVENGDYTLSKPQSQAWFPPMDEVNRQLDERAHTEAMDIVREGPQAILDMLGDRAPEWVRAACEPAEVHAPETLEKPVVQMVSEPVATPVSSSKPVNNQFQGKPVATPVQGYSIALAKIVQKAPYTVPVQGPKGQVYHIVKTAIAAGKSQNWMVENLFQLSKGKNQPYQDAVSYIKWAKQQ